MVIFHVGHFRHHRFRMGHRWSVFLWRGFLQRRLGLHMGDFKGWIVSSVLYAAVHISSLNFMLVGAAGIAGLFWGFMYWRLGTLWPVVISHAVWTCLAFAVAPIR